jgi:hypothetical protein
MDRQEKMRQKKGKRGEGKRKERASQSAMSS